MAGIFGSTSMNTAPSPCCPDVLGPMLNRLLDCLTLSLQQCGTPACRVFLATDVVVPWDQCCDCGDGIGQAWVNVTHVSPILTSHYEGMQCPPVFEAAVKVGIMRCALTQDEQGNAPDACDLTAQALAILQDRSVINAALFGCWSNTIEADEWTIGEWSSLGPSGGCVGGQVSLTIRFRG